MRRKKRVAPSVRCQGNPVSDALTGSETLHLDGGMRRKVHDGEYRAVDVPERGAGAGGGDTDEGAVLRSKKDTVQDVIVGAES